MKCGVLFIVVRTIAKDHGDKRLQILNMAAKVFATQGFDRASMSSVAAACSISKANIYHYYSGKNEILFDILDNHLVTLRDHILELNLEGLSNEQSFRKVIEKILLAYHGADYEHQVQINALAQLPDEKQLILRKYQADIVKYMAQKIAAIASPNIANDQQQLHSVTMSVFGMLNWFYMWNNREGVKARKDYAKTICDLTLKGVVG